MWNIRDGIDEEERGKYWNAGYDRVKSPEDKEMILQFSEQMNREIRESERLIREYEQEIYFDLPAEHYEWDDEYEDIGVEGVWA